MVDQVVVSLEPGSHRMVTHLEIPWEGKGTPNKAPRVYGVLGPAFTDQQLPRPNQSAPPEEPGRALSLPSSASTSPSPPRGHLLPGAISSWGHLLPRAFAFDHDEQRSACLQVTDLFYTTAASHLLGTFLVCS